MAHRIKLPIFEALQFTYRWTLVILRKHWIVALVYVLVPSVVMVLMSLVLAPLSLTRGPGSPDAEVLFVFGGFAICAFALIYLALIAHNEVQRGEGSFDRATVGAAGVRACGYLFDYVIALLVTLLSIWLVGSILMGAARNLLSGTLPVLLGGVCLLLIAWCMLSRLLLRLPSRAVGDPLSWSEVWRLGRGNSLRLLGGSLLIALVFLIATVVVSLPLFLLFGEPSGGVREVVSQAHSTNVGPIVVETRTTIGALSPLPSLIMWVISCAATVVEVVAIAAYLSLAYVYLRQAPQPEEQSPPAPRAEPAF